nr:MAG TPA: hypothetical protein [Caudoviricetes sp.]
MQRANQNLPLKSNYLNLIISSKGTKLETKILKGLFTSNF